MHQRQITPLIAIADQPAESDLEQLTRDGVVGVVNLRTEGEPEQPLSPAAEGDRARALGLEYLHVPVGGHAPTEREISNFVNFLDLHADREAKVLVHCRKGGRAAALVLLYEALRNRWGAGEAVEKGRALGLEVEGGLRAMVEAYLRDHAPGA